MSMDQKTFDLIQKVANEHCHKRFGYFTTDDLKNEIWVICLEAINEFDSTRGELEHFLRVTVKNRLANKFKDVTKFVRSPCPRCVYFAPGKVPGDCRKFKEDKYQCVKWKNYQLSLQSRNSLINAHYKNIDRPCEGSVFEKIAGEEFREILIDNISPKSARDAEQFLSGGKISKQRYRRLQREIRKVVVDKKIDDDVVELTVSAKPRRRKSKKGRRNANSKSKKK